MAKNSIFRRISDIINYRYTRLLQFGGQMVTRRNYKSLLNRHPHGAFASETEYIQRWNKLQKHPDVNTYRLFAQYIGEDPRIAPEDIISGIIQPLLNPIEYRGFYQDKNLFEKLLPKDWLPTALLRGIRGNIFDRDYRLLHTTLQDELNRINQEEERVFIKPSVDSSSGEGVIGYARGENLKLYSMIDGTELNAPSLLTYINSNPDFILQRGLTQHPYVSQFNPSSINTIRIATYRSVIDGRSHFINAIIRIGKTGTFVDNAHAGGLFVGIDHDGTLGKYACDQYGNKYDTFNGINFKDHEYIIPEFDRIRKFSEEVASQLTHARLVAQDICIQEDGSLKLVEFNIRAFSSWLFQFTSGIALGEWTDEIIDYCVGNIDEIKKVIIEPF